MKPNEKSQLPEKDTKGEKSKAAIPKGKHAFECGGCCFHFFEKNKFTTFTLKNLLGTTFLVDEKFEFIKQIGHGAYGVVCSALNKENNNKVAIKKVKNCIFSSNHFFFFH